MGAARERLAPFKVNLFLEVVGRRADGYHELFTVMDALDVGDLVRVERHDALEVTADRDDVPDGEGNLAARIVREAERRLARALPARIAIAKLAPPATGLGAGSSDAVAALKSVLELHGVAADPALQREIAAAVGSDTPFFVEGGTAACLGRGEIVGPPLPMGTRHYVLAWGAAPAPTSEVYAAVDLEEARRDGAAFLEALARGEAEPFNRLEEAAFSCFPELREVARELERSAGRHPHLAGSGSAFYFLLETRVEAEALAGRIASDTGLQACAARTLPG